MPHYSLGVYHGVTSNLFACCQQSCAGIADIDDVFGNVETTIDDNRVDADRCAFDVGVEVFACCRPNACRPLGADEPARGRNSSPRPSTDSASRRTR